VTVSGAIWRAAGAPAMLGDEAGVCRACGLRATGSAFTSWVRPTFTDHDKLAPGEIVCHACQFCFTDQNAALAHLVGKAEPQRTRNYSHFVLRGEWIPLSKGDKRRMRDLLLEEPAISQAIAKKTATGQAMMQPQTTAANNKTKRTAKRGSG
jgi:hypothetical protein